MKHVHCNYCGKDDAALLNSGPDLLLDIDGTFTLVQCNHCGLIYQNPQLEPDELAPHYPDDYLPFQEMENDESLSAVEQMSQNHQANRQVKRVLRHHLTPGRVLDVGCATGTFLAHMRPHGFTCVGVEPGESASRFAREAHGLQVTTGILEDTNFADASFDMVTLWDVLEHVEDPRQTLKEVVRILKPAGTLILSLPNPTAIDAMLFGANWVGWERPRHLHLYSPKLLNQLLEETGFTLFATESFAGRLALSLLSVEFWLKSKGVAENKYRPWLNLIYNVPLRLLTMPYYLLIEKLNRSTTITFFARRKATS